MSKQSLGGRVRAAWAALAGQPAAVGAGSVAGRGARRRRAAQVVSLSHYRGAEISRLTGDSIARAVSPVEQLRGDLRILRARARDLGRNDPLAKKYLSVVTSQVLGPRGPRLQAQVLDQNGNPDDATNTKIEAAWADFCRGPVSIDGRMNFYQLEQLCFRTMVGDGEVFIHPIIGEKYRHGLALQGIDPDLVDETYTLFNQPNGHEIWLGIEVDRDGARKAYHVYEGLYSQPSYARERKPIPASEMLHCFVAERFNQARGVTWFAPAMVHGMHLNGYIEAVMVGSRAAASQMGVVEQGEDAVSTIPPELEGGATNTAEGAGPAELETSPGMILRLAPGEKFSGYMPTQPTDLFDPFTASVSRFIATGLGVSYAALTGDFSKANYSSERAAQLVERILYTMIQELWICQFRQPIYERWLETAVLSGALRLPSYDWKRYAAARWMPKGFDWVDPWKEIQALQLELQLGMTSVTRALAERGEEFEEILREIQRERILASRYGIDLAQLIATAGKGSAPAPPAEPGGAGETDEAEKSASGEEATSLAGPRIRPQLAAALNGNRH